MEDTFAQLYMKRSTENIKKEARENPRCCKMMDRHNNIMIEMEEKNLSKDGKKKLKSRLNSLVVKLSQS